MIEAMGRAVYGTPQYRPPGLGTATGNTLGTKRKHGVVNVPTFLLNDYLARDENRNVIKMALAYQLDVISQGPKKSRFPGPNPCPLALVMDAARIKSITHGAV
jgi:hypothetical protein